MFLTDLQIDLSDPPPPPFPGFLVFLAMAVYTGVTINYHGKRYGNWRFSWSYIIGWVSVVLTFFSGK